MRFVLQVEPSTDRVVRGFGAAADAVESWRRPLGYVGALIRNHAAQHLDSEGRTTGPQFQRLTDRYKREKDRRWPGRPVLTRTGALLAAMSDKRSASHMQVLTDTEVVAGIDPGATTQERGKRVRIADYALAHQLGLGGMPVRPVVRYDTSEAPGSFGAAVREILQWEITYAAKLLRAATQGTAAPAPPDAKMARVASRVTR